MQNFWQIAKNSNLLNNIFILIAINKYLSFNLLLLKINVMLLIDKMKIFSNLKKLKPLLILRSIFKFFKKFTMPAIFAKLTNLNNSKDNTSLKKWLLMRIKIYMALLVFT